MTTATRIGRSRPLARGRDAPGSHTAADKLLDSGAHSAQNLKFLAALKRRPFRTSKQLAAESGLDRHMVGRRLPDLKADGYALERTDRPEKTWTITAAGLELCRKEGL